MKKRSCFRTVLAMGLVLCILSGCSLFEKDYPVTVAGVTVKHAPESVACLSEGAASAVSALGYGSYLTGAPSEFITGEEDGLADLGSAVMPDQEAVYSLSPDVLITPLELSDSFKEGLELRGITVIVLATPEKYSDIAPYYTELAKLFLGKKKSTETAETYIGEMNRNIADLKARNTGISKKAVVFIEDGFVVTGDTLAGQAMEQAGMVNIAAEETGYMMSAVAIAEANPDVIFCAAGSSEAILKNETYAAVTAIKNGAVYEIDTAALAFAGEGFCAVLQDMSNYLKQ